MSFKTTVIACMIKVSFCDRQCDIRKDRHLASEQSVIRVSSPKSPSVVFCVTNLQFRQNLCSCDTLLLLLLIPDSVHRVRYRVILSLEAPNYCLCIQSNSVGFSFVNTGKKVHLKHARRHLERNLVENVHHRSVASRNWLKS